MTLSTDLWGDPIVTPLAPPPAPLMAAERYEAQRERARQREHARWAAGNPLVRLYGPGPEGTRCKTCKHLYSKRYAGTYYKCDLRHDSGGPATDHRVNWPACGCYEPQEETVQA